MTTEQETASASMANRVAAKSAVAFDPTIIIAIISAIIQVVQGCKKPTPTPSPAKALLDEAYTLFPDVCPPGLRKCFRENGVSGWSKINDLWSIIVDDAHDHQDEACAMMVAA